MTITELHKKRRELSEKLSKVETAIRALQDICEHEWKDVGHDSHKNHYECPLCGAKDAW